MTEQLQDERFRAVEHNGETPREWEKSLLKDNTEDLARFAVLVDQPLHTPTSGKDSSVSEKKYSHPDYALNLINPEQPQYQEFLDQIYKSVYPDQNPPRKEIYLAFDVDAMDRLLFAANNLFIPSDHSCMRYDKFDAQFTDLRINGGNVAHIAKNEDIPDARQKYGMCDPMRLVSAAIVPMKVEPGLLHHQESREDVHSGIQGILRLSDEDMRFADTLREAMYTDHEWARLDPAVNA